MFMSKTCSVGITIKHMIVICSLPDHFFLIRLECSRVNVTPSPDCQE